MNREFILKGMALRHLGAWNRHRWTEMSQVLSYYPTEQRFSKFSMLQNLLEGLLKHRVWGPTPGVSSSVGLMWGLRNFIFNKSPGEDNAAGQGASLWKLLSSSLNGDVWQINNDFSRALCKCIVCLTSKSLPDIFQGNFSIFSFKMNKLILEFWQLTPFDTVAELGLESKFDCPKVCVFSSLLENGQTEAQRN